MFLGGDLVHGVTSPQTVILNNRSNELLQWCKQTFCLRLPGGKKARRCWAPNELSALAMIQKRAGRVKLILEQLRQHVPAAAGVANGMRSARNLSFLNAEPGELRAPRARAADFPGCRQLAEARHANCR